MEEGIITLRIIMDPNTPPTIRGASWPNRSGFNILINPNLPEETQARAFLHEMLHIWRGDHDSGRDLNQIEQEVHEQAFPISRREK